MVSYLILKRVRGILSLGGIIQLGNGLIQQLQLIGKPDDKQPYIPHPSPRNVKEMDTSRLGTTEVPLALLHPLQ